MNFARSTIARLKLKPPPNRPPPPHPPRPPCPSFRSPHFSRTWCKSARQFLPFAPVVVVVVVDVGLAAPERCRGQREKSSVEYSGDVRNEKEAQPAEQKLRWPRRLPTGKTSEIPKEEDKNKSALARLPRLATAFLSARSTEAEREDPRPRANERTNELSHARGLFLIFVRFSSLGATDGRRVPARERGSRAARGR